MKRRPGVWIVAFLTLLAGCVHAAMMGGMGLDACAPRASGTCSAADTVRAMAAALRSDLLQLRELDPDALVAFMPDHRARIDAFLKLVSPATPEEHAP